MPKSGANVRSLVGPTRSADVGQEWLSRSNLTIRRPPAKDCSRRNLVVPASSREGLLTEPTAAGQPCRGIWMQTGRPSITRRGYLSWARGAHRNPDIACASEHYMAQAYGTYRLTPSSSP